LAVATTAGRLVGTASRLAGRGTGASIRGQVMLAIDPGALTKLLAPPQVAMVSGTNGKTTTTHFLTAAVRATLPDAEHRVVHNTEGANLVRGIVAAVSAQRHPEVAILETDERVVAELVTAAEPEVLVLLNFSPDQMDRHLELTALARSWRQALQTAGSGGPAVVANAKDPLVVWAAESAHRVLWVATASAWTANTALCPDCGGRLLGPGNTDSQGWHCRDCRLNEPKPDYRVAGNTIVDPQGDTWDAELTVPGRFNVDNAACALAAANLLGVGTQHALEAMRRVASPAGRFGTARFGDVTARLFLAKNPAGWSEILALEHPKTLILAVDAAIADGRDTSWLWDVDYEQLAGHTVVATGPRAADLAVRLRYAEVEHRYEPDLGSAVSGHTEPVDVISNYTPFQQLRKMGGLA
jgi:UDP-N-acetylmuramyl tripeptide synthase